MVRDRTLAIGVAAAAALLLARHLRKRRSSRVEGFIGQHILFTFAPGTPPARVDAALRALRGLAVEFGAVARLGGAPCVGDEPTDSVSVLELADREAFVELADRDFDDDLADAATALQAWARAIQAFLAPGSTLDVDAAAAAEDANFQAFTGGVRTAQGKRRICFSMRLDAAKLDAYKQKHEHLPPLMQAALRKCGWDNYSLFCRADGLAIGVFETPNADFAECRAKMGAEAANGPWQDQVKIFTACGGNADEGAVELDHYFFLGEDRPPGDDRPPE